MEQSYDEEIKCPLCKGAVMVTARVDDTWRTLRPHPGGSRWCVAGGWSVADARAMADMQTETGFDRRAHP